MCAVPLPEPMVDNNRLEECWDTHAHACAHACTHARACAHACIDEPITDVVQVRLAAQGCSLARDTCTCTWGGWGSDGSEYRMLRTLHGSRATALSKLSTTQQSQLYTDNLVVRPRERITRTGVPSARVTRAADGKSKARRAWKAQTGSGLLGTRHGSRLPALGRSRLVGSVGTELMQSAESSRRVLCPDLVIINGSQHWYNTHDTFHVRPQEV